jgi:threonine dehydrogenase-like Zn-dependent dehydrogenase
VTRVTQVTIVDRYGTKGPHQRATAIGTVTAPGTPTLLRMSASGRFITRRFELSDMAEAYDVFSRPQETGALKVVLHRR